MNVVLFKARHIGFQQEVVALVGDVGLEFRQSVPVIRIAEESLFKVLHVAEGVIIADAVVLTIRSEFKHDTYLQIV